MESFQLLPITPASSPGDSASSKGLEVVDEKFFGEALSQAKTTFTEKDDSHRAPKDESPSKADRSSKKSPGSSGKSAKVAKSNAPILPISKEPLSPENSDFEIKSVLPIKSDDGEISPSREITEIAENQDDEASALIPGLAELLVVSQQLVSPDTVNLPFGSQLASPDPANLPSEPQVVSPDLADLSSEPQVADSDLAKPPSGAQVANSDLVNLSSGQQVASPDLTNLPSGSQVASPDPAKLPSGQPIANIDDEALAGLVIEGDKNQNHTIQNQTQNQIQKQTKAAADPTPGDKPNVTAASTPQAPQQEPGNMSLDKATEALPMRITNVEVSGDIEIGPEFSSNLQKDIALIRDTRPAPLIIESALPETNSDETQAQAPTEEAVSETAKTPVGESDLKDLKIVPEKTAVSNQPDTTVVQKDAAPVRVSQPAPPASVTEAAPPEPTNKEIQAQAPTQTPTEKAAPETAKTPVGESEVKDLKVIPEKAAVSNQPDTTAVQKDAAPVRVSQPAPSESAVEATPHEPTNKGIQAQAPTEETAPETAQAPVTEVNVKTAPETVKKPVREPDVKVTPETAKTPVREPDVKAAPETPKEPVSEADVKTAAEKTTPSNQPPSSQLQGNQPNRADAAGIERQTDSRVAITQTQDHPQKTETADSVKDTWNIKVGANPEFGTKSDTSGDSGFQGQQTPEAKTSFSNTVSAVQSENTFAQTSASLSVTTPNQPAPVTTAVPRQFLPPQAPMAQLEGSVRWLLRTDTKGAEIQLHPENLGRVVVRLRVEGAEVHARVWATEASTMPLLENHRAFLESSLKEQGLNLSSFDLQHGKGGQQAKGESQQQHNHFGAPMMESWTGSEFRQELPTQLVAKHADDGRIELYA